MEYGDAEVRRLRGALVHYRSDARTRGRKRTWERIAEDILESPSTPRQVAYAESDYPVLGEAMRRFCAGTQTLSEKRLNMVRAFLIDRRYIQSSEEPSVRIPPELARNMHRLFNVGLDPTPTAEHKFEGQYYSVRKDYTGRHEVTFLRAVQRPDGIVAIDLARHAMNVRPASYDPRELRRVARGGSLRQDSYDGWIVEGSLPLLVLIHRLTGAAYYLACLVMGVGSNSERLKDLVLLDHRLSTESRINFFTDLETLDKDGQPKLLKEKIGRWSAERAWHFAREGDA